MTDHTRKKSRIQWLTRIGASLLYWDEYISHQISDGLPSPFLHKLMTWFSNPPGWLGMTFVAIIIALTVGTGQTRRRVAILLFSILLSDQTCNLIKSLTKRVRPYGTDFSFPSSHAANMFCASVLLAAWLPAWADLLYLWAALVGFSRIYLKKHYLLDVFVGTLIGVLYARLLLTVTGA
ncbi:MAG TPA: phosphatase PAP2 family protein [Firmicutes bacterium]|nr:phosphatase PAP2 family protein [Bacillota bacterium]